MQTKITMMSLNILAASRKIKWRVYIKSVFILFAIHLHEGIDYLHTLNHFTYSTFDDDVRWNFSKKIYQLLVSNIFIFQNDI